ncbi:PRD domain-containing protein [Paenibacillus sp. ACRRX]|uniref:PRD domain-containing protein n=1 Tax=Paenibacillus sp. ACRRX TaxID=2918206 RepID=UPI001EF66D91|nr:PRD domain-containing protein [Paenibacillus sp. ACRRX]MCG7406971.1 PRD domain-containing protein [Paenibacillus sp. ACRRX]
MLQERLKLLYASQQMDTDTYKRLPSMLAELENKLGVPLQEDNAGAFVSHYIKAIQRVKAGTPIQDDLSLIQMAQKKPTLFQWAIESLHPFDTDNLSLDGEAVYFVSYFEMILGEEPIC